MAGAGRGGALQAAVKWPAPPVMAARSGSAGGVGGVSLAARLRRLLRRLRMRSGRVRSLSASRPPVDPDSFYGAVSHAVSLAQVFGVFPVGGARAGGAHRLRFRVRGLRVLFAFAVLLGALGFAYVATLELAHIGFTYPNTAALAFYGGNATALALFLRLAGAWPALARRWAAVDAALTARYGPAPALRARLRARTALVMGVALVEHLMANATGARKAWRCGGVAGWLRAYCLNAFRMVFARVPYSAPLALAMLYVNVVDTFVWNFTDLFLMHVSAALSARFRQLNARLEDTRGQVLPACEWRELREDFNRLATLTHDVDATLSNLVFFAFANNLYFICLQLFRSLSLVRDWGILYFYVSFGYVLARTAAVLFLAADVHAESRRPRAALYAVPAGCWGVEAHRFLTQVLGDDVALTGLRFFAITRTLILTVAGTVATYEVVLLQLDGLSTKQKATQERSSNQSDVCP